MFFYFFWSVSPYCLSVSWVVYVFLFVCVRKVKGSEGVIMKLGTRIVTRLELGLKV